MQKNIYDILVNIYGDKFKNYREQWDKASKGEIILDFPLHINFELKIGCNLKCPSCLCSLPFKDWPYPVSIKKEIKIDKYFTIIDECAKHGLLSIELNGVNEPFLYENIVECIKYAREKGIMHISLHTNAMLLTKKLSQQIMESGLTTISFSLDSFYKETYNKVRVGGDYNKVIKNINNFLNLKKTLNLVFPFTRVSLTRSKINFNEIEEFKSYWNSRVNIVSTSFFYNPFVGNEQYNQIEKDYRLEKRSDYVCYQPYQRIFIFNNGNVAPCCSMFGGNLIVGNIYNSSIFDIWNSYTMKTMRQNIKNKKILLDPCRKCKIGDMGNDYK